HSAFSNYTEPVDRDTLPLHDALPIFDGRKPVLEHRAQRQQSRQVASFEHLRMLERGIEQPCIHSVDHVRHAIWFDGVGQVRPGLDRKSTRLNSSHVKISYAVFCLKKK